MFSEGGKMQQQPGGVFYRCKIDYTDLGAAHHYHSLALSAVSKIIQELRHLTLQLHQQKTQFSNVACRICQMERS